MTEKVKGLPARRAALRMMDAVTRRGEPLDQAANAAAKGLQPSDRALAIAIAQEAFRWLVDIDAMIDGKTHQPLPEDAKARSVLRIALAQMLRLQTPHHAAIATALALITGGPKRLVHGILGNLSRENAKLPELPTLPEAVAERWSHHWGDDIIAAASQAISQPPALDIALKDHGATQEWAERMEGISLAAGHIRLPRGRAIETLPGFDEGAWWVQDLAASLPARLLDDGKGRRVLDLCAAPGGKTMQLAAAGWKVTALDKSSKRLQRLEDNLERTGLSADIVATDAFKWESEADFDAILLDAPCSATGTFRRHPDVLHRIGEQQVSELTQLQTAMLEQTTKWIKPGGHIVYATCSLEPEEGEKQLENFLTSNADFARAEIAPEMLPDGVTINEAGDLRTLPTMLSEDGGLDGFFAAILERK